MKTITLLRNYWRTATIAALCTIACGIVGGFVGWNLRGYHDRDINRSQAEMRDWFNDPMTTDDAERRPLTIREVYGDETAEMVERANSAR